MTQQPSIPAVDDEDPNQRTTEDGKAPHPSRRKQGQDVSTRDDLPGDAVQPGLNEATDDPN